MPFSTAFGASAFNFALPVFRALAFAPLAVFFLIPEAYAADKTWNNTGTDFNSTGSWTGGVPGSGDAAIFDVARVTNPNLSASVTIDHLEFSAAGASGYNLTSSSTSIKLTLLNTTTGTNAAIRSAITSGSNTIDAPIVLGAASGQTQTFNQSSGGTLIVNGVISSTNTVGLSLRGGGTVELNGANTYTGNTSIDTNNQTLILGNDNALSTGTLTNNALGATIQAGGGARTISNAISLAANTTFSGANNLALGGVVSGNSTLTKSGSGTLTLSAANTYTGVTTLSGGVLLLSHATALSGGIGASGGTTGLTINGGVLGLGAGNFSRGLGTGASQVQFTGSGGFAAYAADRNVNLGGASATVTWGSGSFVPTGSTFILGASGADKTVTFQNPIALGAAVRTIQVDNGSATVDASLSGVVSGTGGLTKTGNGTLTLSAANTFTGSTTVSAGTLTAAASSGSALASTSGITVNSGGTLLLGASDEINNSAGITLAGGTFAKGDFSEGATNAAGVGALTLTASGSELDFGTGTVGVLSFASFAPGANTLVIDNWTGTANTVGSASTDRLIFNSDQTANLASFSFTGYVPGAVQFALGGGFFEITPLTPVPEPATYVAGSLALIALVWNRRRYWRFLLRCYKDDRRNSEN